MGFFTKIEKATASKLKNIFLDADKLVEDSENTIAALEAKLIAEKSKVAELASKAHAAAVAAAEKAQEEAEALVLEAKEAAERAAQHLANVPSAIEGKVKVVETFNQVEPTLGDIVPNDSLATPETPPTNP